MPDRYTLSRELMRIIKDARSAHDRPLSQSTREQIRNYVRQPTTADRLRAAQAEPRPRPRIVMEPEVSIPPHATWRAYCPEHPSLGSVYADDHDAAMDMMRASIERLHAPRPDMAQDDDPATAMDARPPRRRSALGWFLLGLTALLSLSLWTIALTAVITIVLSLIAATAEAQTAQMPVQCGAGTALTFLPLAPAGELN